MQLITPGPGHLPDYIAALQRQWSPNTSRPEVAQEELAHIDRDPVDYLRWMDDPEARGPVVTLPDGSQVRRIPSLRRWLWADEADLLATGPAAAAPEPHRFIGIISLRWMPGNAPLPPHVLGHVGYAIVPWYTGRGHASAALAALLPLARQHGLPHIELTTDPANLASQRIITRNGGVFIEDFDTGPAYGHRPGKRYRISL